MSALQLRIIAGPNCGRSAAATADTALVVGRSSSADFSVMDVRMSRRHFVVVCEQGSWLLRDVGSSNGTMVNDRRTEQVELSPGDTILAGDTQFQVIATSR